MVADHDKPRKPHVLLGAHMSVAGGYYKALERGSSIECTAIQLFTKSNRQWYAKKITPEEALRFQHVQEKLNMYVVAHASYLINLGSDDTATEKRSVKALFDELERCDALAIPYLVLHPGSGKDKIRCIEKIVGNLNAIFSTYTGSTMLLLENMAGQGNTIGNDFETLALIRNSMDSKKHIGFCFDTCHAFAAGYDFRDATAYNKLWHHYDDVIGIQHLKAIHLNDSKKQLGSHVDRHENIGKGAIGLEAFGLIMHDKKLAKIPKILETPKDSLEDDQRNMNILYDLL
jgi:deoxyribonuclease-4